jgi:hypothetical protein
MHSPHRLTRPDALTELATASRHQEIEITEEAIRAYGRLLASLGGRIRTRAFRDGGLICEFRSGRARPTMWRILPDGAVLPDRRYSFVRRGFITAALPQGI